MNEDQLFDALGNIESKYIEDAKLPLTRRRRSWAWKKLITVVVVLLLVILAVVTLPRYENEHYYIIRKNGEFYLEFKEPSDKDYMNMCGYIYHISFASIQEMYDDFTTCNFTETELEHMRAMEAELEQKHAMYPEIEEQLGVPNLNRLCEPVLPEDVSWDGRVTWYGTHNYSFNLSQTTHFGINFYATTEENFDQQIAMYTDIEITYPIKDISVEQVEDRNATVYYIERYTGFNESYWIYDLSSGDKQMIVIETFPRTDYFTNHRLMVLINEGDYYGFVDIVCNDVRPSVEWLASFGLDPLN